MTVFLGCTGSTPASQEGILPLSSFRLESLGIGESGRVVVTGAQNEKREIVALRVVAFGKEFSVPPEKLAGLAGLWANGIRISYEGGYPGLGGERIYIQLQMGFTSSTHRQALITVTEEGKIDVGPIDSPGAPSVGRPATRLPPSSGRSPPAALLARSSERGGEAAADDRSEALRILVPWRCATDRLLMVTHLTGPFGGRRDCIRGTDGQTSYALPLHPSSKDPSVGPGRAETVRIIAYCPGQQIATIELLELDNLQSHEVAIPFIALPARRVQCRIEFPDDVPKRRFELVAYYRAYSGNEFFRISHGFVPQFEFLRTSVPESGEVELVIPDFSRDRFTTNQTFGNSISFSARESGTFYRAFELFPEELLAREEIPETLILRAAPNRNTVAALVEGMRGLSMQMPAMAQNQSTPESRKRDVIYTMLRDFGTNAVPAVAAALTDPDVAMRRNAALVLIDLNAPWSRKPRVDTTAAIPALIRAMEDPDAHVRAWAAHAIEPMGPAGAPAVPALIRLLSDPDEGPRNDSAIALRAIGAAAKSALPALRRNLEDPMKDPRNFARRAIEAIEADIVRKEAPGGKPSRGEDHKKPEGP